MKKRAKIAVLLLVLIIALLHFWPHAKHSGTASHTKVASANTKITDGNVYWDNLKPDTRSMEQWIADCDPGQAYQPSSGVYSFWCHTPYNNKFDNGEGKPADWVWTK